MLLPVLLLATTYCAPGAGSEAMRGAFLVIVDPGHGGKDSGALARDAKLFEKDINLRISRRIAEELGQRRGVRVIMTRQDDRTMSLTTRRQIIRSCRPDLVISIHADSGPQSARGGSVYVLNDAGEAIVTDRIISRSSRTALDDDVGYVLANLEQRASINYAAAIAFDIQKEFGEISSARRSKTANFALLKSPGIPSLLIEMGYMTNPGDVARLSREAGQKAVARAISRPVLAAADRHWLLRRSEAYRRHRP